MASPDELIYSPLPTARSIRLLKIRPAASGDDIHIHLEPFPLGDGCPEYCTVSYTWDGPVGTRASLAEYAAGKHTVYVALGSEEGAGQPVALAVRKNLHEALEQIRANGEAGWLWIDAICINQPDLGERDAQILLMGDVFSSAQKVLVWLGRADEHTDDVVWFHTVFWEDLSKHVRIDPNFTAAPQMHQNREVASKVRSVPPERTRSLYIFYRQRRYLTRAWVIQEIALSREVVVMYGPETVPWHAMAPLYKFLTNLGFDDGITTFDASVEMTGTGYGAEAAFIQQIESLHRQGGPYGEHMHARYWPSYGAKTDLERCVAYMEWVLVWSRFFSVTNFMDRVCAVLGLLTPFWPESEAPLIVPDYHLSLAQFNQVFTSNLIKLAPRLTVLSLVEDPSEHQGQDLPSWVPMYSSSTLATNILVGMDVPVDCLAGVEFDRSQVAISGGRLYVKAWRCDAVVDVAPVIELSDASEVVSRSTYVRFFEAYLRFYPHLDPLYINGESAATALALASSGPCIDDETRRTLPASLAAFLTGILSANLALLRSHPDVVGLDEGGVASVHGCISALGDLAPTAELPSRSFVEELAATWQRLDFDYPEWNQKMVAGGVEFIECSVKALAQRRFYMTESKLLGIGTRSIQPGDEIWMISGSPVPMVLRQTGTPTHYTLMGEAYVHGGMHGELAPFALSEGLQDIALV